MATWSLLVSFAPVSPPRSIFSGAMLDKVAEILSWVVLVVAPVAAIGIFWMVHILPEKIAEKRHHPQTGAIQTLCLLSLVFGGLLWPLAWLWAYTKPVFYKSAYGTDKARHGEDAEHGQADTAESAAAESELAALRKKVAELEQRLGATSGGKKSWS